MSENKTRSKSIGRNPSQTFKSLDSFKAKFLKNANKDNLNSDSDEESVEKDTALVGCKLEKMATLGELTLELEKKKIDGENLDRIMRDLFKQYNNDMDTVDNVVSERFLMINACRTHKDLTPPSNLKISRKKIDLDKFTKLQRVFQQIPTFTNDKNYTIRELLNGLNSIVENLGFDMTESEYELILNQKLSPRVKSAVHSSYKHENLKGLFANLLNLYDSSETRHEAFSAIVNQKNKFLNLHDFTEETLRLLSLSRKNSDQQSQLFIHSVENILPKRVYEKLIDFLDGFEALNKGKYPTLPMLVDFIYKYRQEIDAHMAKNYKQAKYNFATHESDDENETVEKANCAICNKDNHPTEKCFKKQICNNCNVTGHIERYCKLRKNCQKCGKSGHTTANCFVRCRLCNSPAHGSVTCDIYTGLEPAQVPCGKCADRLFIKLFHPTNKCKSFTKN